jgi:hypothetical protein
VASIHSEKILEIFWLLGFLLQSVGEVFPMAVPMATPPGGHQDKAPLLRTVIGVELSITAVVVALRLYTRLKLVRNAGWDDWIMLATFLSQ